MNKRLIQFLLIAQLTIAAAVNYSYDAAGRLVKVDYGSAGSIAYTYDNAGNVTSRTVQAGGAGPSVIASANLVRADEGEMLVEIRGTNLASSEATVTLDGKPARVVSRCNATLSRTCRTDQITVSAPVPGPSHKVRIVVTSGAAATPPFTAALRY